MLLYQSVIDWIELRVQTATPTNAQTVRRALRRALDLPENAKLFVEPLTPGEGGAATSFRFRIQDPKSGRHVAQMVERLGRELAPNTVLISCKVTAIELAFDTYAPDASRRQLAEIVADRYRFSTHVPADAWHLYRGKGEHPGDRYGFDRYSRLIDEAWDKRELLRHLECGWLLTDTRDKEGAAVRFRGYVKTHDFDGEELSALQQSAWRARFEVTLQGTALPIETLANLEQLDFTKLAEYFKFRRLADHLHPAAKYTLANWSTAQLGRKAETDKYRRYSKVIGRKGRKDLEFRPSTVADEHLNAIAYECLRKLTREWEGRGASADFPGESEPETRVDAESTPSVLTMSLSLALQSSPTTTRLHST
jgi:hypothetical protein